MTDYTPTTGEVRRSYWRGTALRSSDHSREDAAFDRWLANVVPEEAKAQAWEEGYANGYAYAHTQNKLDGHNPYIITISNEDYDHLRKVLDEE